MEFDQAIAYSVPQAVAESVRQILVRKELLSRKYKIIRFKNEVIFPIIGPEERISAIVQHYGGRIDRTVVFEKKQERDNWRIAFEKLIPIQLHQFLPGSFDIVGKIGLVRFPKELRSYWEEMAEILLSKTSIRSVYLVESPIQGTFRTSTFRWLAGKKETKTIHKEYDIRIFVEIGKVYFSPRLANEHQRIASLVEPFERVLDMFTGVGAFPLHISRHTSASVFAVDLNLWAIDCLMQSLNLNKTTIGTVCPVLGDSSSLPFISSSFDRIIMNHPLYSIDFVNEALSYIRHGGTIHYYCFSDTKKEAEINFMSKVQECGYCANIERSISLRDISPHRMQVVIDTQISKETKKNGRRCED